MPESPLVQKETVALTDLETLVAARSKGETETELGFRKRMEREEAEYKGAARQLAGKFKVDSEALKADYDRARNEVIQTYQRTDQAVKDEYAQTKNQIAEQFKKDQRRAKKSKEEAGWQALAFFEGSKDEGTKWRRGVEANWAAAKDDLHMKQEAAEFVLKRCGRLATVPLETAAIAATEPAVAPPAPDVAAASPESADVPATEESKAVEEAPATDPLVNLQALTTHIEEELIALEALKLPKFLRPDVFVWPFLLLGGGLIGGLGLVIGWTAAAVVGVVVAVAAAIGAYIALAGMARPGVAKHAVPLRKAIEDATKLVEDNKDWIKNEFDSKMRALDAKRVNSVREAEETMARRVAEFQSRAEKATAEADATYPVKLEEIRKRYEEGLKKVDEHYPPRIAAQKEKYEKDRLQLDESYSQTKATTKRLHDEAWSNLIKNWTDGIAHVNQIVTDVREESERRFLDWTKPDLAGWQTPTEVPPAMRFGLFGFDLNEFPNGPPRDPRLKAVGPPEFKLPALLPFPIHGSVLIKAADAGKDAAITLLQSLMLRYLTSIPPGKVRFTIVDPVGLGENFAAFMHLGDYHELLVTNRIWTEPQHIEQRLTNLTEHMENVIQKYLRNEFETIEEYNTMAGEVAEPFRILVVANFPTNFNDNAMKRLVSIVQSGARCGVYALILLDTKLGLPSGFQIKDLENHCVNMNWKEGRLA